MTAPGRIRERGPLAILLAAIALAGCSSSSATAAPGSQGPAASGEGPSATPTPVATVGPDTFVATGSMAKARVGHTASLLASGQVLIAGGDPFAHLTWTELFGPACDCFEATGEMGTERMKHTATVLPEGTVLVAGGEGSGEDPTLAELALASAELYDPATGKFTPAGSMTVPRLDHTATLLADGRVLIAGGQDDEYRILSSAELYDPATGEFTETGAMTVPRVYHTATLLADGRVLIAGGQSDADSPDNLASAELYDPASGKFTATGSMAEPRGWHTATLLADGRVLIAGGQNQIGSLASAELYDPASGTFAPAGPMTVPRSGHTATLLTDGRVLMAGGNAHHEALTSAELFNPGSGS